MVIGIDTLLERVRRGEWVRGLSEREMMNPEGAGFDLRAGELYRITGSGFLGVRERETSSVELLGSFRGEKDKVISLRGGEYYLVKLIEEFDLPPGVLGIFHPRSTLFRSGVVLQTGVQPPGFKGCPTFALLVAGPYEFRLELGARIAHVTFFEIDGQSALYRGQWQGGRVATDGPEQQT